MDDDQKTEMKKRISNLGTLSEYMGATFTLGRVAKEAMRGTRADRVDWNEVQNEVISQSIGEHGQSAFDVFEALSSHSPAAVTDDQKTSLKATISEMRTGLTAQYRQAREREDSDYAANNRGREVKFQG